MLAQDDDDDNEEEEEGKGTDEEDEDEEQGADDGKQMKRVVVFVHRPPGGRLGVKIDERGVVSDLLPGGAAEACGLRKGDLIEKVDGERVDGDEASDLLKEGRGLVRVGVARSLD